MTDLNAREGDFKGISKEEVAEIMKGAVAIVRQHASYIVSVSCNSSLISEQFPTNSNGGRESEEMRNAFRSPYGAMCHLCMWALGERAAMISRKPFISYVLESGDEGQKGLVRYAKFVQGESIAGRILIDRYSLAELKTSTKADMEGLFHSADLVAWEWAKHVDRQLTGKPMRQSLLALTGKSEAIEDNFGITLKKGSRFLFRYFNEAHVDRYVRVLREMIEAKSSGEVDASLDRWDETRPKWP
ncbi:hypothetical protein [Mesorhizobium sp. M0139]|uniref:hypothetical protein n=1 Tax=Mesorhizobium sp. M0139 TaxID=2956892 RepID=UPI003337463C